MNVELHYFKDALNIPEYVRLLQHEMTHVNLYYFCKNHISPIVRAIGYNNRKDGSSWFNAEVELNFSYEKITLFNFLNIIFFSIADLIYDVIYYHLTRSFRLIKYTIKEHFYTILTVFASFTQKKPYKR